MYTQFSIVVLFRSVCVFVYFIQMILLSLGIRSLWLGSHVYTVRFYVLVGGILFFCIDVYVYVLHSLMKA